MNIKEQAIQLYLNGLTLREVADQMKGCPQSVTRDSIRRWLMEKGIPRRKHGPQPTGKGYLYRAWLRDIQRRYGVSEEQYYELLAKQNDVCAICKKPNFRKRLCVDHCHRTNKVRGLLCKHCNNALGLINDDPEVARNMQEYLTK